MSEKETPVLGHLPDSMMTSLAEGFMLVSPWKPVVLLLPFVAWCWLVSTVFDKHCARFFLPRNPWNIFHLSMGLIAFLAALWLPVEGEGGVWASFGLIVVVLFIDVMVFATVVNKDDRVPAEQRLKLDVSAYTKARAAKAEAKKQGKVELVIRGADKSVVAAPAVDAPEFAARVASENALIAAINARGTQLDLGPSGKDQSFVASWLVDGQRVVGRSMPPAEASSIMGFWKSAAKLDVAEVRKKLTSDLSIERGLERHKLRLTTVGSPQGPRMSILVDPEHQVRRKPVDMGYTEAQLEALKALTSTTDGTVLLVGLPDGGRTTLLYNLVKMHDAYTQNVQTVEIDIQDTIEGAKQNKWDPQQVDGPDFATLTRSILRRDPQVVGVAELPDAATAKEIAKSDLERTRVYVSLKGTNAVDAIVAWCKIVGDLELVAKGIRGVVAEKLIRKVCTNCRVPYQPPPDMLKKLGLPPDKVKQLMKKGGQVLIKNKPEVCPVCQGTGYLSQEGCFELYPLGPAEREMIRTGNINGLRAELRKTQLPTIQQSALLKAVAGLTTIDEVVRVTTETAAPTPPAGPATKPPTVAPKPAPQA